MIEETRRLHSKRRLAARSWAYHGQLGNNLPAIAVAPGKSAYRTCSVRVPAANFCAGVNRFPACADAAGQDALQRRRRANV